MYTVWTSNNNFKTCKLSLLTSAVHIKLLIYETTIFSYKTETLSHMR